MQSLEGARRPQQRRLIVLTAVAVALLFAGIAARSPAASAGGVGKWTNLSGATGSNLTQVGLVATPNGILHVAWIRDAATPGLQDLLYRTVNASGAFGAMQVVQANWSVLNDPALVYDPSAAQLGIVFSGMRSTNPGEVYDGLTVTISSNGGASWALDPSGVFDPPGSSAYASPISAIAGGGVQFSTWYGSDGVWVLRGVSGSTAAYDYQHSPTDLGNYGYYPNFGLDKNGTLWLVWASNGTGHSGLWADTVNQTTGAPVGPQVMLPNSTTSYGGAPQFDMMTSKVAVTGRPKGTGVYVAYTTGYPSTNKVRVWHLTTAKITSTVVAKGSAEKGQTAIAAGPDGRIWVVWSQSSLSGRDRVYVRRSNTAATAFGPAKYYSTPAGYTGVYHLAAIVRHGKLDVLAHLGGTKGLATWHIQFKAPK